MVMDMTLQRLLEIVVRDYERLRETLFVLL